jgi:hypothetical protein
VKPPLKLVCKPVEVGQAVREGVFLECGEEEIQIGRVWWTGSLWRWAACWGDRGVPGQTHRTAETKEKAARECYGAWLEQQG